MGDSGFSGFTIVSSDPFCVRTDPFCVRSIASTMQQMSISFGVATASLATAFFIPNRFSSNAPEMIQGVHHAFLCLGVLTILSAMVFRELRSDDGDNISLRKALPHVG